MKPPFHFPIPCVSVSSVVPLFLCFCLLLASPLHAQTLHRGVGPEPDSLDIHLAQSLSALNVLRDLHEGLVTFDADAGLIAGVASEWSVSDDGLAWTFELNPNARWSDGKPIVAGEFLAGWQRLLDPETAAPTAGWLDPVAGAREIRNGQARPDLLKVEAPSDHRLIVHLERPVPWFAELLTHPAAYPWRGSDRYSGAFVLVEQVPGAHMKLAPNPHYHAAGAVELDTVYWHVIEEPNVELSRYRAGQLHITETIPPGRVDWLREQFGEQLRITPYLGSFYLAFNLSRPPFDQGAELRQALSLAIDRELIIERVLGAGEVAAWRLVPPGMPGWPDFEPHGSSRAEQLEQAQRLYRQAGYSDRHPLRVELRFNTSLTHRRMAAAVAAMWKLHLGVETRLVNEEWKVFVANRRQGRITQIVRGGWIADWRDPANFLDLFVSDSPMNYAFFEDDEYDRLMSEAAGAKAEQRTVLLWQAEERLLEQQAIIPLYYYVSRHLVRANVEGFSDNSMDIHLSRWLSLE